MSDRDYAHYDRDKREYGYWADGGRYWVKCDKQGESAGF